MALHVQTRASYDFSTIDYVAYAGDDFLLHASKNREAYCAMISWGADIFLELRHHLSALKHFTRTLRRSGLLPYAGPSHLTVATDPSCASPFVPDDGQDGSSDPTDHIDLDLVATMPLPTGYLYVNFGTPWGDATFKRRQDLSTTFIVHSHLPIAPLVADFIAGTYWRPIRYDDVLPLCVDIFSFGLPQRGPSMDVYN